MNDYKLVVVKTQGEFVWHKHDETDEPFLVVKGRLTIQFRDRDVVLEPGELFVVPRGVEHCPKADEDTHVLLIEPRERPTTGHAGGERTVELHRDLGRFREQIDAHAREQLDQVERHAQMELDVRRGGRARGCRRGA